MAERRLLEDGANEFEAKILASGLGDGPSATNRRRIIAGLGVALPTTLAVGVAAGPLGWLERARQLAWSKWGLGGAIGAISIYTGVKVVAPEATPPAPPAPVTLAAVRTNTPAPVPEPEPARDAAEPASAAPASLPAQPAVVRGSSGLADNRSSLGEESALLETARRALVGGDARRALRMLDEHTRKFKKPRLPTEATVLRIEALIASGDRARATELGKRFLSRQANGPYERRVRSLIGDTGESSKQR